MSFSHTAPLKIDVGQPLADGPGDPLFEAWECIRRARGVPFAFADHAFWRTSVAGRLADARLALGAHIAGLESGRWWRRLLTPPALARDLAEHPRLCAAIDRIEEAVAANPASGLADFLTVSDLLIEMEIALARHSNRLAAALHASCNADDPVASITQEVPASGDH